MPHVQVTERIRAAADAVYRVVADMESYPHFMPDVDEVKVISREGNTTLTRWVTRLQGRPFAWTERDTFHPEEPRIDYGLVEGDLRKFEGAWTFAREGEDTLVSLTVDFEFGLPMFAALLNPVARLMIRDNVQKMLAAIKRQAESGGAD